ncbi:ATP-binding protein [Nocardioides sp. CN2-186]|uniref:ATP-binding protein n=1 Tax=Nocardioides tweenelious TaxID=3156607 RepID=UPI0032B3F39B
MSYADVVGEFRDGPGSEALDDATDLDSVARIVLRELMARPAVVRVGLALSEGGGRRLRFLSADASDDEAPAWCHIDAYDDVPLTTVVRSGESVLGNLDDLGGRYAGLVDAQRERGILALASVALSGDAEPIGGLIVFYDESQVFDDDHRGRLAAVADRVAAAVHRVRALSDHAPTEIATRATRSASVRLAGDPRAAKAGRGFLREVLHEWSIDGDSAETAELCLSELVTNAVIHAGTSSELTITFAEAALTVVVSDLGGSAGQDQAVAPHPSDDDDPLRVFGRGLVLVDALADSWGSEADVTGTTSWFTLALDEDRPAAS